MCPAARQCAEDEFFKKLFFRDDPVTKTKIQLGGSLQSLKKAGKCCDGPTIVVV
jgi:hypothetical protein